MLPEAFLFGRGQTLDAFGRYLPDMFSFRLFQYPAQPDIIGWGGAPLFFHALTTVFLFRRPGL